MRYKHVGFLALISLVYWLWPMMGGLAQDAPTPQRWNIDNDSTIVSKKNNVRVPRRLFMGVINIDSMAASLNYARKVAGDSAAHYTANRAAWDAAKDSVAAWDNQGILPQKIASGGATSGDNLQWNGSNYVPVAPGDITVTNLQVHGDAIIFGAVRQVNFRRSIDIQNAYASHAATPLMIVLPDTVRFGFDSTTAVHPSVVYIPGGWNGYKYWMSLTYGDDNREDAFLRVSNDGETWLKFPGCPEPLAGEANVLYGKNGPPNHLSDDDLLIGADEKLHMYIRASDTTRNGVDSSWNAIYHISSSNGATWSNPVKVIDWRTVGQNQIMSPTIWQDTSASYKMWTVHYTTGTRDYSWLSLWQSDSADGTFDSVGLVLDSVSGDSAWSDSTNGGDRFGGLSKAHHKDSALVWHVDVIENGGDEKFALFTLRVPRGLLRYYLAAGVTRDGGKSVVIRREPIIADSTHDLSFGVPRTSGPWDWLWIYKSTGVWVDNGNGGYFDLFYGAIGTGASGPLVDPYNSAYRIGRTRLEFLRSATMDLDRILGRQKTPTDSLFLTLGGYADSSSGTADIFVDSSGYGGVGVKTDYVYANFKADDDFVLDSLIFRWLHAQAGAGSADGNEWDSVRTDSLCLWGPDLSSGTNACDSIWWASGGPDSMYFTGIVYRDTVLPGYIATSRTRNAYPLRIHKMAPAGSLFRLVMINRFNAARSAVHVEDIEIKGRSR